MLESLLTRFIRYTLIGSAVKVKVTVISSRGRQRPGITQRSTGTLWQRQERFSNISTHALSNQAD